MIMKNLHVEFDIPATLASQVGLNSQNISKEIRSMLALFLYEHKQISLGKACEIGGINQWEFVELNRQLGIEIDYTQDDLLEDMERLSDV